MCRKVWFGKDIFSFGSVQNVLIFIEVASLHLTNNIIGNLGIPARLCSTMDPFQSHVISINTLYLVFHSNHLLIYLGNFGQPENENTISTDGWTKMAIFDCQFAFVVTFGSYLKF